LPEIIAIVDRFMNLQRFAWNRSRATKFKSATNWQEWLWLLGLLVAALILFSVNLGGVPLATETEKTIAQVAGEIAQGTPEQWKWLFPTWQDRPYFDRPALIPAAIAIFYKIGGVNPWTTRLPGALLAAISVPLLYGLGREVFPTRLPALLAALIYLTFFPVLHYGRLAVLDGPVLCFTLLMMLSVLRSRRDLRWGLGIGLGLALLALTKSGIGLVLGAIALLFLAWDTPRLLGSFYLWIGVVIGLLPAVAWYGAQWIYYGDRYSLSDIFGRSLVLYRLALDEHRQPLWFYVSDIAKSAWPWLFFCLYGLHFAQENWNWSWAKLTLIWSGVYLLVLSLMMVKVSGSIVPIYPALALAGGAALAEARSRPSFRLYPHWWTVGLLLMSVAATMGCIYLSVLQIATGFEPVLMMALASLALTLAVVAVLIERRDPQFIVMLFWGVYVSMLLWMSSPYWTGDFSALWLR
jgi:4-amino-4-deoxy-L-arabinose transferase-like glycosyltransferase